MSWEFYCIGRCGTELGALFINWARRGADNIVLKLDWELILELCFIQKWTRSCSEIGLGDKIGLGVKLFLELDWKQLYSEAGSFVLGLDRKLSCMGALL